MVILARISHIMYHYSRNPCQFLVKKPEGTAVDTHFHSRLPVFTIPY